MIGHNTDHPHFTPSTMTPARPTSATEVFTNLIVTVLAPMFLAAADGDIVLARAAAIETVNGYQAQTRPDLLAVAQIIAFGLAALGSLSLAMAGDIPLAMTLRLRSNAISSSRAGEKCRRSLTPPPESQQDDLPLETAIAVGEAQMRQHVAEARARKQPAPSPANPAPTETDDQERRTTWANAMIDVAGEVTASLSSLTPEQRRIATMRIAALRGTAGELRSGTNGRLPSRFDPRNPDQGG
jgi:hypothetical protein